MSMDRRQILGAIAGVAAAPALANATTTPSTPIVADDPFVIDVTRYVKHPVFGLQTHLGFRTQALRVSYDDKMPEPEPNLSPFDIARYYSANPPTMPVQARPSGNRLSTILRDYYPEGERFKSFEEAENELFTRIIPPADKVTSRLDYEHFNTPCPHSHYLGDGMAALPILINRQANLIAARTRRGAGNAVLMRADDYKQTFARTGFITTAAYEPHEHGLKYGRWREHAGFNRCMTIYVTDNPPPAMRPGLVLIAYRGKSSMNEETQIWFENESDAGGYIVTNGNGDYLPLAIPYDDRSLGNAEDYFGAVQIDYSAASV